mgnify:FL=1|jgi:cbb3-type cytochrome oxidase maturation protein
MEIIYITIPLVLIVGSLVVAMFIWMAKKGQFDDLDGAAHRILLEEEQRPVSEEDEKSDSQSTNKDSSPSSKSD